MSDEAKWYVVHTYSGYENKVASNIEKVIDNRQLRDLIHEVKVPTEKITEIKDNKTREVVRKIFPGYVLVKMVLTDESWYIVRNTRGCTGFVGDSTKPLPLSDKELEKVGIKRESIKLNYAVNDSVKITSGPLENFVGTTTEIDIDKNCVKLLVSMFGRETPVELELDQVEPVN